MGTEVLTRGVVARALPMASVDGSRDGEVSRLGRYRDCAVMPFGGFRQNLADEGSYFVATTPTPGTGIAEFSASTSFSDTRAFIVVQNADQAANAQSRRLYLDYIKLMMTGTAPAGTTVQHFAAKRSTISREPTTAANKTLLTPVNMASASGRASIARPMCYSVAAAMAVPASDPKDPVIGRCSIPTSLGITGDEYILKFGGEDLGATPGLTAVRATAAARLVGVMPPVVLEPGEWFVLHRWWPTEATNFPTYEIEMAWWER